MIREGGSTYHVNGKDIGYTPNDIIDIKSKLGLEFNCPKLLPLYKKYFNSKGIFPCLTCRFDELEDPAERFNLHHVFGGLEKYPKKHGK